MAKIFVSYSRSDYPFAKDLVDHLRHSGHDVFFDLTTIVPGSTWLSEINSAIIDCNFFALVISPFSISSSVVNDEINLAFKFNKKLVSILLEDCEISDRLSGIHRIDFRTNFSRAYQMLSHWLEVGSLHDRVHLPHRYRRPKYSLYPLPFIPSPLSVRISAFFVLLNFSLKFIMAGLPILGLIFVPMKKFDFFGLMPLLAYFVWLLVGGIWQFFSAYRAAWRKYSFSSILTKYITIAVADSVLLLMMYSQSVQWRGGPVQWEGFLNYFHLFFIADALALISVLPLSYRRWMPTIDRPTFFQL